MRAAGGNSPSHRLSLQRSVCIPGDGGAPGHDSFPAPGAGQGKVHCGPLVRGGRMLRVSFRRGKMGDAHGCTMERFPENFNHYPPDAPALFSNSPTAPRFKTAENYDFVCNGTAGDPHQCGMKGSVQDDVKGVQDDVKRACRGDYIGCVRNDRETGGDCAARNDMKVLHQELTVETVLASLSAIPAVITAEQSVAKQKQSTIRSRAWNGLETIIICARPVWLNLLARCLPRLCVIVARAITSFAEGARGRSQT